MQALGVAVICLLAACYSPGYKDCEITCSSGACPSGFTCEQGVCRAAGFSGTCGQLNGDGDVIDGMTIDGPPNDVDGDMVLNTNDNCPNHANTNQANEDEDALGDVCDPCPIGPTAADNDDSDMDGVGNGCEPEASGMHRIFFFTGFRGTVMPPLIEPAPPNAGWIFANGGAVLQVGQMQKAGIAWPQPNNGMYPADFVRSRMMIDVTSSSPLAALGAGMRFDASQIGIICALGRDTNGNSSIRLQVSSDPFSGLYGAAPYNAGQMIDLTMSRIGDSFSCHDKISNAMVNGSFGFTTAMPHAGLTSYGTSGNFEWLMIISRIN